MTAGCGKGLRNVCAYRARFHMHLARFGKTPLNTTEELDLLSGERDLVGGRSVPNKIMLIHVEQMADKDKKRSSQLLEDLRTYLNLPFPLPPLKHEIPSRVKAKKLLAPRTKINICDEQHKAIRRVLLQTGQSASKWIEQYFMGSDDVFVSSPDNFKKILASWKVDPCKNA